MDDELRRRILDRRCDDTVRQLASGSATPDELGAVSAGLLASILRDRGVDARGIDRLADADGAGGTAPAAHVVAADWFTYDVGRDRWGAILSHMSFSNHFLRHHRRGSDEALRFAARYVEILGALRVGGRLHYAPALPFIELLLAPDTFDVRHSPIPGAPAHDTPLAHATTVTRLR